MTFALIKLISSSSFFTIFSVFYLLFFFLIFSVFLFWFSDSLFSIFCCFSSLFLITKISDLFGSKKHFGKGKNKIQIIIFEIWYFILLLKIFSFDIFSVIHSLFSFISIFIFVDFYQVDLYDYFTKIAME